MSLESETKKADMAIRKANGVLEKALLRCKDRDVQFRLESAMEALNDQLEYLWNGNPFE